MPVSYARHRFPPSIIQHAVWLYLRFTLSYRDVEDLLAERGLEDQLVGIEVELAVEPGLPRLADVLALLLGGVRGLILYVRPCRSRNFQTLVIPTRTSRSASSRSTISASEMSFVPASTSARMKSAWASSREPRGLPWRRAVARRSPGNAGSRRLPSTRRHRTEPPPAAPTCRPPPP